MRVILVAILMCSAVPAEAQSPDEPDVVTPIELALVSPVHIFHGDRKLVAGLSINLIYGDTWRQYGVELGLVNHEVDSQVGLQIGALNIVEGDQGGIQIGGLVNVTMGAGYGLIVSGFWNHIGRGCRGICINPIGNSTENAVFPLSGAYDSAGPAEGGGIMIGGFVNAIGGHFGGVMLASGANFAAHFYGLQISCWNTGLLTMSGVQIGLFNNNGTLLIDSQDYGSYSIDTSQTFHDARTDGIVIGLFNVVSRSAGLLIGAFGNFASTQQEGVQIGTFNFSDTRDSDVHPFLVQLGAINIANDMAGVQLGAVNVARDVDGVQIGVLNIARRLHGVQLGGIHIAYESPIPFLVGANVGW